MNTPNTIKTFDKPEKFIDLGTGYWYYNYNITSQEVLVDILDPETQLPTGSETKTEYSYIPIRINGKPEYEACVLAVIRQYVSASQEFDLINSNNSSMITGGKPTEEYVDYLLFLEEIKKNVKADFAE